MIHYKIYKVISAILRININVFCEAVHISADLGVFFLNQIRQHDTMEIVF